MRSGQCAEHGAHRDFEPQLSPDFAERVMRRVGRIRARRRLGRRIAVTFGVAVVLAAVWVAAMFPATPTRPGSATQAAAAAAGWDNAAYSWEANSAGYPYGYSEDFRQTTALEYMLPDAQSLMDFSNRYWNDSNSALDYASWNS